MVPRARLDAVDSGLAPADDGWFVVNAGAAAWLANEAFGFRCVFEADVPVVRQTPGREVHKFGQMGFTLTVLAPGQPSGLYHAETAQEDFLVLAGRCLLLIEDEERLLRAWDFVHCPPGTAHAFVGAGDGPCAIFMTGARASDKRIDYPRSELAARHGAGADRETSSPSEAYAAHPHWRLGRPDHGEPPWG
jgi:uncharacterized cupin superfamily protein